MSTSIMTWTPEQVDTIKRTVAQSATPSELQMFLHVASKNGLDPLMREIWLVQNKGKNQIMTARDGYLKIANSSTHFMGMLSDVVCEKDRFTKQNTSVIHRYTNEERGKIIGAYALVYRDDRPIPTYFYAHMADYYTNSGAWLQYPHAMIIKVAESMALKRAFAINGLVTKEEIGIEEPIKAQLQPQPEQSDRSARLRKLWKNFLDMAGNPEDAKDLMTSLTGKNASSKWSEEDIDQLERYIKTFEVI